VVVAVDPLGVRVAQRTVAARRDGFGQLVGWARELDSERVWLIEDVRHVSGSLERFLIDRGETVVGRSLRFEGQRAAGVRERGKSDPIDALAIAATRSEREPRRRRRPGLPASSSRSGCRRCTANGRGAPGLG
jgi:hypothetical protein